MATARKTKATFNQSVAISIDIDAPPSRVWKLLTDAADFARWNSTVVQIDGQIKEGNKIKLKSAGSDRIFNLKVDGVKENERMTWSDGIAPMFKGVRTFCVSPTAHGVRFEMEETFSGLMLPLIKGQLPDFGPIFETYAHDLKAEAERTQQSIA